MERVTNLAEKNSGLFMVNGRGITSKFRANFFFCVLYSFIIGPVFEKKTWSNVY